MIAAEPSPTLRKNFYDRWHASVADTAEDDLKAPWHRKVAPFLHLATGRRVLEIGSGRGALAKQVMSLRPRLLVACDYSPVAVRMARDLVSGPAFVVADIQTLPFRPGSFELAISCETVEHVPEPRRAVAELSRALTEGGTLLLTTPNYLGIMGVFRIYKRLIGTPFTELGQPINNVVMLPRTRKWFRDAGLKVVQATSFGHYLPMPGRPPLWLPKLDRLPLIGNRLGLHSFVRAVK